MSYLIYLIGGAVLFMLALFFAVLLHEWGHYAAARMVGVKVVSVRIGFGKSLFTFHSRKSGVTWSVGLLIFGGETKLLNERDGTIAEKDLAHAFNRQALWRRITVILAGSAASIGVPVLVIAWLLSQGIIDASPVIRDPYPGTAAAIAGFHEGDRIIRVNGATTPAWWRVEELIEEAVGSGHGVAIEVVTALGQPRALGLSAKEIRELGGAIRYVTNNIGLDRIRGDTAPIVGRVVGGGAAARAGLQSGDFVLELAGERVATWKQIARIAENRPNMPLNIRIVRDGEEIGAIITPTVRDYGFVKLGTLGIFPLHELSAPLSSYGDRNMPGIEAIRGSMLYAVGVFQTAWETAVRLVTGKVPTSLPSAPVTAAETVTDAMHGGPLRSIALLCALSFAIGWFNLLPIPPLDGGQAVRAILGRLPLHPHRGLIK